jgi:hypothetical protein
MTTPAYLMLPAPMEVRVLLTDLLGRDVEVSDGSAWAPLPHEGAVVAEFVDDSLRLAAICMADLQFSAYAGASVGLLPAGGANDMIEENSLSPMVVENLYEVLNVMTSVFNKPNQPHVKITNMHGPGGPLPLDVKKVATRLTNRLDLKTTIAGYGTGRLALILA